MVVGAKAAAVSTRRETRHPADSLAPFTMNEKRFSPSKLAVLIDVLAEAGVAPELALAGTGLDADALANPFTLTSPGHFLMAARNGLRHTSAIHLGVEVGRRIHASCYGMYGYALLCAESMAQAFDTAVKYHQLANGQFPIRWSEEDGAATWLFPERASAGLLDADLKLHRFLIDLQFNIHVTVTKDVMGSWCVPARAQFAEPAPPHAALLCEALECPIAFDQRRNALSYPAGWLTRPPQLANPITAAHVSTHCARLMEDFRWQAGVTRRVYQELTRTPGCFPEIDAIAESMCMTSRTLRRKLESEGSSYGELLTSVRKALAFDYLATTELSTEDIAQTLGFSDAVSFRHAFKRWTGLTPNGYRRERAPSPANRSSAR